MIPSPTRIRDRGATAFVTALLFVGACGGGTEPAGTVASSTRDVPPTWRQPAAAGRDNPGSTREPPGLGREPPSGGTVEPGGIGAGSHCITCLGSYVCVAATADGSSSVTLSGSPHGGDCIFLDAPNFAIFRCDGSVSATGALPGDVSVPFTGEGTWTSSPGGGFRSAVGGTRLVCHPLGPTSARP